METAPHPGLLALYRWTLRLAPESHQREYADEQVRLFEEIWRDECPAGLAARVMFSVRLVLGSVLAALAVHLDQGHSFGRRERGRWTMGSDVRFTWRAAARSPWYSGTVVGVMAITIALAATTLAIVDGVLFSPLPFPDADRLVRIQPDFEGIGRPASSLDRDSRNFGVSGGPGSVAPCGRRHPDHGLCRTTMERPRIRRQRRRGRHGHDPAGLL